MWVCYATVTLPTLAYQNNVKCRHGVRLLGLAIIYNIKNVYNANKFKYIYNFLYFFFNLTSYFFFSETIINSGVLEGILGYRAFTPSPIFIYRVGIPLKNL